MNRSERKRRRQLRLTILAGVVAMIVGLIGVRWLMVKGQTIDAQDGRRAAGLTAYAEGNHEEALANLNPYLKSNASDVEALLAAAKIHELRGEDDETQLIPAVSRYRRIVKVDPEHREATERLLNILSQYPTAVESEMVELAEKVRRWDPNNLVAIKAQATALPKLGRLDEGVRAAESYLEQEPEDLVMQRKVVDLMKEQSQLPATILARTASLRETYPDNPAFTLLEAYARLITDDRRGGLEWLDRAAATAPPNETYVQQQVQVMDEAGRFIPAMEYLEVLYAGGGEPASWAVEELIRRRFENGLVFEAHNLIETLPKPSMELRTLNAIALLRAGRQTKAQTQIEQIAAQPGPGPAAAAELLTLVSNPGAPPKDVVRLGGEALAGGVISPYLDLIVAEVHERLGQGDQAVKRYESALRRRPSWGAPCVALAQLLLERGETGQAARYALAGMQRLPENLNASIIFAQAIAAEPARLDNRKTQEVLGLIDRVQRVSPGEPRTLGLRIKVLAGRGQKSAALDAIEAAMAMTPPPGKDTLLALVEAAREAGLDAQAIQQAYVERFGASPQITMLRSMELADQGDNEQALTAFDAAMPAEPTPEWKANRALLLERLGLPEATAAWIEVGDALPENLKAQQSVLRSAAAWDDRTFIARTIERIKAITGEDAAAWRVAKARWLLESEVPADHAEEADQLLSEALAVTPDDSVALVVQARAKRMLGRAREATGLLERAVTLTPNDPGARIELSYVQYAVGESEAALGTARSVATLPELTPSQLRRTAQLLINGNDMAGAARMLERLRRLRRATPNDFYTLAQIYQRQQRSDQALELIDEILQAPTSASVAFVADLQARAGQKDKALDTLDMLDELELTPTERQTLRGAHLAVHSSASDAEAVFEQLTQTDPSNPMTWRNLVSLQLRSGQIDQAVGNAQLAIQSVPGDAGLSAVADQKSRLETLQAQPGLQGFWIALLEDDPHRPVAARAFEELEISIQLGESLGKRAEQLANLADANPDFEALQLLAVTMQIDAGQVQPALQRASSAMQRFSNSPQAAKLAAEAYASVGRWRETALAADMWSQRLQTNRSNADTLAAKAYRLLGRPDKAIQKLGPYRQRTSAQPTLYPSTARELALSLSQTGEASATRRMLEPVLTANAFWRLTWLDAVVLGTRGTLNATDWLETVEPLIAESQPTERAALAQAWWTIGARDNNQAAKDRGRKMARTLSESPDADAKVWFFLGTVGEDDGDLAEAERAYRRAIALDPAMATAKNNLAMVLANSGGNVTEAIELAESAIQLVPAEANFRDTLAFILAAAGRFDEAESAIQRAIDLDPSNPLWQKRLNEIIAQRPPAEDAQP